MSQCRNRADDRCDRYASLRGVLMVAMAISLVGCVATRPRAAAPLIVSQAVTPVPVARDLPLKLIAAELAVQRGDLTTAAKSYVEAAQLSSRASIAEHATRVALAVKQWSLARVALARWQELAPDAPDVLQAQAWIQLAEGDVAAAERDMAQLLAQPDGSGWRAVAQVLLAAEDKAAAAGLLARLATPARLGKQEANWIAVSQLALKLDDKPLAARLADSAVTGFHGSEGYAWQARLALSRGDKPAARDIYAGALRRHPKDLSLRSGYAALLADEGEDRAAANVLARGEQTDFTYAARAAYLARADAKSDLAGLYAEVKRDTSPHTGRRLFLLGQLAELVDPPAALTWFDEVPRDDERWFSARVRVIVLTAQQGRPEPALALLERLRSDAADDQELGDVFLLEAELRAPQKNAAAVAVYTRGLLQLPNDSRLLYARAMVQIERDDLTAAEADLRRIIAVEPDNAEALNALGYTLADRTPRAAEALQLIEKALALKPDEPAILDSYGWAQFRLGHLAEAEKSLRRAFAGQADAEIAAHLGEVLWARGERDEARAIWQRAAKQAPDNTVLKETMRRLDR